MLKGFIQQITVEESTRIQWVKWVTCARVLVPAVRLTRKHFVFHLVKVLLYKVLISYF